MHSLESSEGSSRRAVWAVVAGVAILAGLAGWFLIDRQAAAPPDTAVSAPVTPPTPADAPTTANAPAPSSERTPDRAARSRPAGGTAPPAKAPSPAAAPAPAARELRVTADVDGAYVFLDRKFLGSTPLVSRDVTPGSHQLNVQVAGRPPQVQTIEVLAEGPTVIDVTLSAAAVAAGLDASVPVVHQHGMGSCEGTLCASGDTLRYDTTHKDAFSVALASLEQFSVDYQEKRLRVKARGRTWNFTTRADTADPLFVFHRDVDAVRGK
jgi:hypothetical protein